MAKKEFSKVPGRLLNSTERRAISKLMKLHQPVLREMEKWKDQREKLETALFDQIEMIGEILKPYYEKSRTTLVSFTRPKPSTLTYVNKKTSSRKKSRAKKSGTK